MYVHQLFWRSVERGVVTEIPTTYELTSDSDEPVDRFLREADYRAKSLTSRNVKDGVLYKVSGETVYFVSKYYFLYPNYTDEEPDVSAEKGLAVHRRPREPKGSRGNRQAQRRAA
ncbi:hypothetical protein HC928_02265 [bacterium]|nr:hypothetical protein [bacterium]